MNYDNLPVEKQDREINLYFSDKFIKDNNSLFMEKETNKHTDVTNGVIYNHSELDEVVTYPFYKRPDVPTTYCDMIGRKYGSFTTKHQPNKKSKKAARRNNRRAKRNNR